MCLSKILLISYRRARQLTNILAAPVSATVRVANVHSALMHAKLLFPDKSSRFNELMQMHTFVAIIEDILSSHDKNKIHVQYTTTHACTLIVNVPVIIEPFHHYSRNGNLSTLILIPTPSKPTAYSSVISS